MLTHMSTWGSITEIVVVKYILFASSYLPQCIKSICSYKNLCTDFYDSFTHNCQNWNYQNYLIKWIICVLVNAKNEMIYQDMKRYRTNLNNKHYYVKEANLKMLYDSHYATSQKRQNYRDIKNIRGWQGMGVRDE